MTYSLRKAQFLVDMADDRRADDFITLANVIRARNAKDNAFQSFLKSLEA